MASRLTRQSRADGFRQCARLPADRHQRAVPDAILVTKAPTISISRACHRHVSTAQAPGRSAPGDSWASAWAWPLRPPWRPVSLRRGRKANSAFGFFCMEVETIRRVIRRLHRRLNNNASIAETDINPTAVRKRRPTASSRNARDDKMMEAFGGVGVHVTHARRSEAAS